MKTILLVPTEIGVGLTSACLGLIYALECQGIKAGFLKPFSQELQPEPESLGGAREDGARQLDVLRYALCRHGRLLESRQHLCHARYRRQAVSRAELLFQGVRPHGQGQCPPGGRPAGRLSGRPAEVHRVLGRKCGRAGECPELGEKRFGGRKPHGFRILPFGACRRQGAERRRLVGTVKP